MLQNVLLGLHIIISLGLIVVVVLQSGKSAGLGTIGGGAENIFGKKKGLDEFLNRATAVLAFCFMATSLTLTVLRG